ncbi:hypothetical protein BDZ94DRAFT_1274563 [Collybia nuda]|uniref:Uncharacterized protein n=1 Tax=Collybia nuda TaxID=64659 RepID=A0A9P5XTR0_9AGAR|nr:hypothetical protein BDZ94DRAFT_1274563 [Collybia nuda]
MEQISQSLRVSGARQSTSRPRLFPLARNRLNAESSKIQTKVFYTTETRKPERVSNILKQHCES